MEVFTTITTAIHTSIRIIKENELSKVTVAKLRAVSQSQQQQVWHKTALHHLRIKQINNKTQAGLPRKRIVRESFAS